MERFVLHQRMYAKTSERVGGKKGVTYAYASKLSESLYLKRSSLSFIFGVGVEGRGQESKRRWHRIIRFVDPNTENRL